MADERKILLQRFAEAEIPLTEQQADAFLRYESMLREWNAKMNLTAITDFDEVVVKHFLDSVFFLAREPFPGKTLIDVGSGAGFPGIPLKILFPQLRVTLLDSLGKRIQFLEPLTEALGLENVFVIQARAEEGGRAPGLREAFDMAVARAVAPLGVLAEYCLPFVKPGGCFLSYKGDGPFQEMEDAAAACRKLGGSLPELKSYQLPGTDFSRSMIVVRKLAETPEKYPRRAGAVSKKPLK